MQAIAEAIALQFIKQLALSLTVTDVLCRSEVIVGMPRLLQSLITKRVETICLA